MSKPLALISVSDKAGIVDFARGLHAAGFEILSTGGTAKAIAGADIPVTPVQAHTGHPEMMNGRVKTLHPLIHGGILGLRDAHQADAEAHGVRWIDVVAVNLYPFEATVADPEVLTTAAVEQIDIGGPSMVRSAAKNHQYVTLATDPADYAGILAELEQGGTSLETRQRLAVKGFRHTAAYDSLISSWLATRHGMDPTPEEGGMPIRLSSTLRYGENPHQGAAFYTEPGATGRALGRIEQLQGKKLSFNNLADLDATLRVAFEFEDPACVIVKHMNPCGAATTRAGTVRAFELALSADPVSAYGGIVAFNRPVDGDTVRALRKSRTFFEILAAPGFSDEAKELLAPREKLRVMSLPDDWADARPSGMDARRVQGGWLLQDWDGAVDAEWRVATSQAPDAATDACLAFAWAVCRNVKSNAIVLARAVEDGYVLNGVGAGQMSRVDSVELAIKKATRPVEGSVLASDAFFPFPDGVEAATKAGVRAIIQPGGSIRDDVIVAAAEGQGCSMVFTQTRHFRH
jgi:phosphoribosylaminoimidazolecarboxamide formyltransferase/IMP cyclohydrolase